MKTADLEEFLKAAGELRVKGITRIDKRGETKDRDKGVITEELDDVEDNSMDASFDDNLIDVALREDATKEGHDVNPNQHMSVKKTSDVRFENKANLFQGTAMTTYQEKPKLNSLIEPATMAKIESMIEKRVDGNYCTKCGYTSKKLSHMKEHVEKHIEGLEYPCNSCNKILRSFNAFRTHRISP